MSKVHGRFLSGLGGPKGAGYDVTYRDTEVLALEAEDDTDGSGIFDQKGRLATSNPDTGSFASHNSLPGYISREVPFTVSRDVTDITDDAAVIYIPGGGMINVEKGGDMYGAPVLGPVPRGPKLAIAPPTGRMQPYADLIGPPQAPLFPRAPVRKPPLWRPRSIPRRLTRVPKQGYSGTQFSKVPFDTPQLPVPTASIVHGGQSPIPVRGYADPVAPAAPDLPMEPQVPAVNVFDVGPTRSIPISGLGQAGSAPMSPLKLAVAGLMVGAAAGLVMKVI
jgi:hypothetical protein